ncbi:Cyclic nucleotide-gated cation channel subunit A [Diplonema papillatum]|nr:Cyclic nucleotide-gated cation channel subunit A [Diplonema papillatum]
MQQNTLLAPEGSAVREIEVGYLTGSLPTMSGGTTVEATELPSPRSLAGPSLRDSIVRRMQHEDRRQSGLDRRASVWERRASMARRSTCATITSVTMTPRSMRRPTFARDKRFSIATGKPSTNVNVRTSPAMTCRTDPSAGKGSPAPSIPLGSTAGAILANVLNLTVNRPTTAQAVQEEHPQELSDAWVFVDVHDKGYLNFEEVEWLLDDLGVRMDDWKETEFFHAIDANRDGRVSFDAFAKVYRRFIAENKFVAHWSRVHLACVNAARLGTLDAAVVVRTWHNYDTSDEECLAEQALTGLLKDLGLPHEPADVREFMDEVDPEEGTLVYFQEFSALFSLEFVREPLNGAGAPTTTKTQLSAAIREVQILRAAKNFQKTVTANTEEQKHKDALDNRLSWYDTYFSWVLFAHAQANVFLPVFLLFINPFGFETHSETREFGKRDVIMTILLCFDLVYLWHVYVKFHLPRPDELGIMVYTKERIRKYYMYTPEFALDLFVLIPFELLAGAAGPGLFLHPVFRLTKIALLWHVNQTFHRCLGNTLGPTSWRITNALYWWVVLAHFVACLFLGVARKEGDALTWNMLYVRNFSELPEHLRYLQALSYAVNTMAGLSRGTVPPGDLQQAFALGTCLIGVYVYALMLAVVAMALNSHTQEARFYQYLNEVKDVLKSDVTQHRLPAEFAEEALAYHRHVFATTGLVSLQETVLDELPLQLEVAITLVCSQNTIARVPIFQTAAGNEEFIYALQKSLIPLVVPPNHSVITEGELGHEMFFLTRGTCDVIFNGAKVHELTPGTFFGEIALLASCPRTATITSTSYCNLLMLSQDKFAAVADNFPDAMSVIEQQARQRIREMMALEQEVQHVISGSSSFTQTSGPQLPLPLVNETLDVHNPSYGDEASAHSASAPAAEGGGGAGWRLLRASKLFSPLLHQNSGSRFASQVLTSYQEALQQYHLPESMADPLQNMQHTVTYSNRRSPRAGENPLTSLRRAVQRDSSAGKSFLLSSPRASEGGQVSPMQPASAGRLRKDRLALLCAADTYASMPLGNSYSSITNTEGRPLRARPVPGDEPSTPRDLPPLPAFMLRRLPDHPASPLDPPKINSTDASPSKSSASSGSELRNVAAAAGDALTDSPQHKNDDPPPVVRSPPRAAAAAAPATAAPAAGDASADSGEPEVLELASLMKRPGLSLQVARAAGIGGEKEKSAASGKPVPGKSKPKVKPGIVVKAGEDKADKDKEKDKDKDKDKGSGFSNLAKCDTEEFSWIVSKTKKQAEAVMSPPAPSLRSGSSFASPLRKEKRQLRLPAGTDPLPTTKPPQGARDSSFSWPGSPAALSQANAALNGPLPSLSSPPGRLLSPSTVLSPTQLSDDSHTGDPLLPRHP